MSTQTLEKVRAVVIQILDADSQKLTAETHLVNDLGADSLDFIELMIKFEEQFDIEIDDDDADAWKTIADIVKSIDAKLAGPQPTPEHVNGF